MKKALVVVDMQNDFIDGALGTREAEAIVPLVEAKIKEAGNQGQRVIFTMDTHGDDYLKTAEGKKLPVEHCIKGRYGWEINPVLQPYADEVLEKSAFGSVQLPQLLKEYDEIELVGLCTDICVISNAILLKSYDPEKRISVDSICCAGVTPESHNNALSVMKMCHIDVL